MSPLPVLDHTVVDGIQCHQHSDRHQLFAQFPDIVGDNPRLGIHVGRLGECAQGAGNEEFRGKGQPLCFRFRLHLEQTVEVFQRGDRPLVPVTDVRHIDLFRAAAQDGLFFGRDQPTADQLLKQAQDKLALGHDRIALIAIGAVHIQRIDVGVRRSRDADDLAAEGFHQMSELGFHVKNQDIILRGQGDLRDLLFGAHRFAGAGYAQAEAVAVEQLPTVHHDTVLTDGVLTVVHPLMLHNLLGVERNEYRRALGGQGAQCFDAPQSVGQHGVQTVPLLPAQRGKLAQVLTGNGEQRFGIIIQLLFGTCHMDEGDQPKHHPLVAGGQIIQHLLGFLALKFHVIRYNGRPVVVGVLLPLPVGHVGFHTQQRVLQLAGGLIGGDGQNIDGQHQVPIQVAELRHKAVFQVAGEILEVEYTAHAVIDLEMVSSELHAAGAQPVFEMLAPPGLLVDIELGSRRVCRTEKVAEDPQALIEREFLRHRGQCRQLGGQIGTDAGKVGAGFLDVALDDTDGKIPLPDDAIVALGDLSAQHLVEFLPVVVQAIFLERQQNRPLEFLLVDPPVVQSDLGRGSGGQCIEQVTVVQEHRRLIILAGDGIVDVGERPGLGELVAHLEDPVRPDATNGNAVLHAARNEELYTLLFPRFGQGLDQWCLSLRLRFFCFGFFIRIPPWIAS